MSNPVNRLRQPSLRFFIPSLGRRVVRAMARVASNGVAMAANPAKRGRNPALMGPTSRSAKAAKVESRPAAKVPSPRVRKAPKTFSARPEKRDRIDPDNPFAQALAGLKGKS